MDVEEMKGQYEGLVNKAIGVDRDILNAKVRESKKRMKEANREDKPKLQDIGELIPATSAPARSIFIEISGQRIKLCAECAREYLRI